MTEVYSKTLSKLFNGAKNASNNNLVKDETSKADGLNEQLEK